jgi:translation initiation factor IF-1
MPSGSDKEEAVELRGTVVDQTGGGFYVVELPGGHRVLATLAGRMRRSRIRVVRGDRVQVALSPYDPTRGRIIWRE